MLDELGERRPAGNGSGEGERGSKEACSMQDGVQAQVAEMAGCLRLLAWNVPRTDGMGQGGGTREALRSSGMSRKERICKRSSEGRDSKGVIDNSDIDESGPL
jgi:hypothetical protein